jgi:hypothetical protein
LNLEPSITSDWPDWMNPILVKELRQSLRSRWFEMIFLWLCGSLTLITAFGTTIDARTGTTSVFWIAVVATFHLLLPLRSALSASDDQQRGNVELIRVIGISAETLANQRFTALFFHTLILASLVLPHVTLRYFMGGIDLIDELQYLALLTFTTPVVGSVFLWLSILGTLGRIVLGVILFFLFILFESLIAMSAFAAGEAAVIPFVLLLFGSLIGFLVAKAFVAEAYLLERQPLIPLG